MAFDGTGWGKGGSSKKETIVQVFSSLKVETRFLELKSMHVS